MRIEPSWAELEASLGHEFTRPELLLRALTHRSLANQMAQEYGQKEAAATGNAIAGNATTGNNERLEFLGDAVLNLVVAEELFRAHPEWQEGELTQVRSHLVSRQHLARVAKAVVLAKHVRLGCGEDRSGLRHQGTLLSNAMEAVIGALFLDAGLEPVRAFVCRQVMGETADRLAQQLRSGAALGNYKSALQECLQASRAGMPVYRLQRASGPDHSKRFLVEVLLKKDAGGPDEPLARGTGRSKKDAEQDAARRALSQLAAGPGGPADPADPESSLPGAQKEEPATP